METRVGTPLGDSLLSPEILKHVPLGFCVIRLDDQTILYVNAKLESMFGYDRDELIGKNAAMLLYSPTKERFDELTGTISAELAQNGEWHGEVEDVKKDGTRFWSQVNIAIFTHAEFGQTVVSFHEDITEKKAREEEVAKDRALLNEMGEIADIGGWEFDVKTLALSWTSEVYRIHEVDEKTYVPTVATAIDFYDTESRPVIEKAVQRAIDDEVPFDLELGIVSAVGTHKIVHAIGKTVTGHDGAKKVRGIFQDITERKDTENSRFQLLSIIENSLDEIYVFDAHSLKFQMVNRGALENIGYSMEEMTGLTPLDIKPEFTETSFRQMLEPLLKNEQAQLVFETVHRRKDGSEYPIEVHLQLHRVNNNDVFFAIINDIAGRKRAEAELHKKLDELEKMNRFMVNREMKMIELKKEIEQLKEGQQKE